MRKGRFIELIIVALFVVFTTESFALEPSSVPGIMVPAGFDAEVFATGLNLPARLAFEANGNLIVGSDCSACPVVRLSPAGSIIASSNSITDPDGVAVDSSGRVFVAGSGQVTIANSLNGGSDVAFAPGFSNLDSIAIDSTDRIVVAENDGRIREISASGVIVEPPIASLGEVGNPLAFDTTDKLFAGTINVSGGSGSIVMLNGVITPITAEPVNPAGMAFDPGCEFGRDLYFAEPLDNQVRKVVDVANGTVTPFVTGIDFPIGIAVDSTNAVYVSEKDLGRVIRIFPTGDPVCSGSCQPNASVFTDSMVVNLDARAHGPSNSDGEAVAISFPAGTYKVTLVNPLINEDACYTAWTPICGTHQVLDFGVPRVACYPCVPFALADKPPVAHKQTVSSLNPNLGVTSI